MDTKYVYRQQFPERKQAYQLYVTSNMMGMSDYTVVHSKVVMCHKCRSWPNKRMKELHSLETRIPTVC